MRPACGEKLRDGGIARWGCEGILSMDTPATGGLRSWPSNDGG
jgi:hypothetical protein